MKSLMTMEIGCSLRRKCCLNISIYSLILFLLYLYSTLGSNFFDELKLPSEFADTKLAIKLLFILFFVLKKGSLGLSNAESLI